ncbi:MAG TPA: FAD-binding oxidoreductase [Nitrososphaeraceae archaeon]|jgi:FAD/FMN-containing dehydrogenase
MSEDDGRKLANLVSGETLWDDWTRKVYSVDASNFVVEPLLVSSPKDEFDIQQICKFATARKIPLVCRGAGTGLLGQSLSSGIVIDFARNMDHIVDIGDDYVIAEPGITKSRLDRELLKRGKFIPPNPVSSNYCTVGGMIANNSSGPLTLGYGSIMNYLSGVSTVYSNGEMGFAYDNESFDNTIKRMVDLVMSELNLISRNYPKVDKNSSGYRLDSIITRGKIHPQRIFLASEGTLGIVTKAKLRTLDIPEFRYLLILSFPSVEAASAHVPSILKSKPVALELLDTNLIVNAPKLDSCHDYNCSLLVEFHSNKQSKFQSRITRFENDVSQYSKVIDSSSHLIWIEKIWGLRQNALNSILKRSSGARKSISLIEDTVVAPSLLKDFACLLIQLYKKYDLSYVIYGHAGDGNLHTRPIVEPRQKIDSKKMKSMAFEVFNYVRAHGGSISGEHGDGLARVKYIPWMYGTDLYEVFIKIKKIFDRDNILNPGKKVLSESLR